jgi:hypothetical protein
VESATKDLQRIVAERDRLQQDTDQARKIHSQLSREVTEQEIKLADLNVQVKRLDMKLSSDWEQMASMEVERGKLMQELDQMHRTKTVESAELVRVRAEFESAKEQLAEARREMSR